MSARHISRVAVVGAGGNVGRHITEALLKIGKHAVTAITRSDSQSKLPDGVQAKPVDYDQQESLVEALRGHEALAITIGGRAPIKDIEAKLVRAAANAGVQWIMPNEWSPDSTSEAYLKDLGLIFNNKVHTRQLIENLGKSSYISLCTGFWYEYSLRFSNNFGFNFTDRTVRFFGDGQTKISTSTWPQVGRAVAGILSLPVNAKYPDDGRSLESLRNKVLYVNSFTISQRDMLESALRVTRTAESDWTISKIPAHEEYSAGIEQMKQGGWPKANFLYARVFYDDGNADFERIKGTINEMLCLPKEELDQATEAAIEMQRTLGASWH